MSKPKDFKSDVEKVIRDGKVAVLYSPGFGAGWSTWAYDGSMKKIALFHPAFVKWVEDGKKENIDDLAERIFGTAYFYTGGANNLEIEWLPVGTQFVVDEYDGSESITINPENYIA